MPENHGTILVVEDEPRMLRLLERTLSEHGYAVFTAADGEEAIETYCRHKTEIDVVLLDVELPKIRGSEVFLKIKAKNPYLRVVIASGYLEPKMKKNMSSAGAMHFLPKPYKLDKVVETIRNLMSNP